MYSNIPDDVKWSHSEKKDESLDRLPIRYILLDRQLFGYVDSWLNMRLLG
jgi:hypothetical protein